jgi:ribosome biogenesis GTPase / thiamine phosphate phosphatase
MHQREQSRLQTALADLSANERRQLYKQAAKLRQAAQTKRPSRGRGRHSSAGGELADYEEAPVFEKVSRSGADSLNDWVLRLLAEDGEPPTQRRVEAPVGGQIGIVVSVAAGRCSVLCDTERVECFLRPELAMGQQTSLAVGDEVRWSLAGGSGMVEEVLPRRTTLSRPDPFHRHIERVIAANIDAAVIVVSILAPPLHPSLIDRYLIAIQRGGAEPIVCVNKIDLIESAEGHAAEMMKLQPYRDMGVRMVLCSASDGHGVDALLAALSGKLCVFVGHSGVGKSSLLNSLRPELNLATNTLRVGDGKGRHTTTGSQLYELAHGIRVIDTPGVREFGLWKLTLEEARGYFAEFTDFATGCRFSDCSHLHEPACAVRQAVIRGRISSARYESYRRIASILPR